jgi:hypothetical protein
MFIRGKSQEATFRAKYYQEGLGEQAIQITRHQCWERPVLSCRNRWRLEERTVKTRSAVCLGQSCSDHVLPPRRNLKPSVIPSLYGEFRCCYAWISAPNRTHRKLSSQNTVSSWLGSGKLFFVAEKLQFHIQRDPFAS